MAFKGAQSAFDLAGNSKGLSYKRSMGDLTDPEVYGKGAEGYQLTKQSDDSYAAHSLSYDGIAPSSADMPDGFLDNMFDNANWKSLTPQAQAALYNKAFVGDYLWDVKWWDKPNVTAGGSNPQSDKTWGTSHDSTHGLDIARVIPGSPPEQGNYSDVDLWRMDQAKQWEAGADGNPGVNMDTLYKHMTQGEIDWAHYNGDGLYQAAAWQLDQDGNKNWVDQGFSKYSTVDQIRSADALLGTMNAQEEQELLTKFKAVEKPDNTANNLTLHDDDDRQRYQEMNPDDKWNEDAGIKWQHTNSKGETVNRHYIPTYQQTDYQLPKPGEKLNFSRVDEGDPRAGEWDPDTKTLVWGGKNIDAIRNTKLTPRSDIVPPTVNIPSNMTQQIYRPDNLPANVYGTITSDAVWTDKNGKDKFAAGGKSQSLTIRDGKLIKGDTFTPRSQNLSDMTIKAGGK